MRPMERDIHALRERWGDLYDINWMWREQVFRAVPHGDGPLLEHREPGTLWNLIADDQARRAAAAQDAGTAAPAPDRA